MSDWVARATCTCVKENFAIWETLSPQMYTVVANDKLLNLDSLFHNSHTEHPYISPFKP